MPPSSPITVGIAVPTTVWSRAATKLPTITTATPAVCWRVTGNTRH